MKLFGLRASYQAHDDNEGRWDYGVFSSRERAMGVVRDELEEEDQDVIPEELEARRVEYRDDEVEVTNGLYRSRIFQIREYELDGIREWDYQTNTIKNRVIFEE